MKQNLRVSLGAVVLALATLAAMIFAWLNFVQRAEFETPDDGVVWLDTTQGIQAQQVASNSPAARAGVRLGDHLLAINGAPVIRQVQVTKRLWRAGLWTQVRYGLARNSEEFETPLVTAPAEKPTSIENYARAVGLIYLFIGLFIFARRWNAPRAVHFYIFCLVSFIFFSFHYSGKLDSFDYEVYWIKILAQVLMPALLLHFALVFPERAEGTSRSLSKLSFVYLPPLAILLVHVSTARGALGFVPWLGSRVLLDKIAYSYLGGCFLAAGLVFYRNYRGAPAGVLRQQLKWLTAGTFVGTFPFVVFYILPYAFDAASKPWMKFSTISLVFIPLCFAYAIIRYRLMDVDIIFKRGLAYTAATAAIATIYFFFVALIPQIFHAQTNGPVGGVIAIVIAALLFQPFREWIQARLDRFFYRDRLDYRRTLIEFGRTLTNEVRLSSMLGSVRMDRVSQTLLVRPARRFSSMAMSQIPGTFSGLARSMGVRLIEPLDLRFPRTGPARAPRGGRFFFESPRARARRQRVRASKSLSSSSTSITSFQRRICAGPISWPFWGWGKIVDGDYLSWKRRRLESFGNHREILVAVALDNAQLYTSLEQKALEIARLKDFSENIVESLNVGVLAVDLEGLVESWNTRMEQLFGVARQEAVGRQLRSLLPEELAEEIAARGDAEQITGIYKQRLHHHGKALTLNVSITPLVSKSAERIGRLLLFDDVTQRERMEEQMSQTEKLTSLGLLAAGVAHEVNTPLAVISNYIQMLAKQMPDGDPRQSIIEKIVKQTFRASEIVNNLLNAAHGRSRAPWPIDVNRQLPPRRLSRLSLIR